MLRRLNISTVPECLVEGVKTEPLRDNNYFITKASKYANIDYESCGNCRQCFMHITQ